MISRRLRRSALYLALAPASSLLLLACSPPSSLEVGLNEVHTDVVFGAKAQDEGAPRAPGLRPPPTIARPHSLAPSFIAPPPPVDEADAPPEPPEPPVVRCPSAGLYEVPEPAGNEIEGAPAEGVYPFDQKGSFQIADDEPIKLPTRTERTIQALEESNDGGYQYEQVVKQFGAETTTLYRYLKSTNRPDEVIGPGNADPEGIYIGRVTTEWSDGDVEQFAPAYPGLRIFPAPANVGVIWDSVAVDALGGTAMKLTGAVRERFRVDACGDLVEGWRSHVSIDVTTPDSDYLIKADYIVMPQLGGLIAADKVKITGRYHGEEITQTSQTNIRSLKPVRAMKQEKQEE